MPQYQLAQDFVNHLYSKALLNTSNEKLWFPTDHYHLVVRLEIGRVHARNGKADFLHELQQLPKGKYLLVA
ncbi:MAG: hypothetical protein ACOYL3_29180, partial [Desulfuromonadaceae bacterium]